MLGMQPVQPGNSSQYAALTPSNRGCWGFGRPTQPNPTQPNPPTTTINHNQPTSSLSGARAGARENSAENQVCQKADPRAEPVRRCLRATLHLAVAEACFGQHMQGSRLRRATCGGADGDGRGWAGHTFAVDGGSLTSSCSGRMSTGPQALLAPPGLPAIANALHPSLDRLDNSAG